QYVEVQQIKEHRRRAEHGQHADPALMPGATLATVQLAMMGFCSVWWIVSRRASGNGVNGICAR
ncbi:hypothetical protein KQH94_17655, partial [Vibrio cholerae]|uniref:hypothetical protein n=1 Tax=Vibrio cholerae TaxID=666 RepID=UPI001C0F42A1